MSTYNDKSCDPLVEGSYTGEEIPPIDQKTIECNLTRFTAWLNRLVDQVNYLSCLYLELRDVVLENRRRIECLEERMDAVEGRVTALETRVGNIETRLGLIETRLGNVLSDIDNINNTIAQYSSTVSKLYSYLPAPISVIDDRSWKFGMGNINVMSANNGTAATTGPGIFTSDAIENNDLYFN